MCFIIFFYPVLWTQNQCSSNHRKARLGLVCDLQPHSLDPPLYLVVNHVILFTGKHTWKRLDSVESPCLGLWLILASITESYFTSHSLKLKTLHIVYFLFQDSVLFLYIERPRYYIVYTDIVRNCNPHIYITILLEILIPL